MNTVEDTIAAVSTPVGRGGIGIVRLSGPKSACIAGAIFRAASGKAAAEIPTHTLVHGDVIDPDTGTVIDQVLLSIMRAPHSYTREDVAEVNCHGGMLSVQRILDLVLSKGARLAEPGEFTKRAFLNGRINLVQAEAVSDLITALTDESLKIATRQLKGGLSLKLYGMRDSLIQACALAEAHIDFPEDEIDALSLDSIRESLSTVRSEMMELIETFKEARYFREGLSVAIIGRPNVGKSSLLNALLKKDRAIVTEIPGTTRDLIEEYLNIDGLPVKIVDTAGIRKSDELVEKEGIKRSLEAMEAADFIVAVFDGSEPAKPEDYEILQKIKEKNAVIVVNKSDLPRNLSVEQMAFPGKTFLHISAVSGKGIDGLEKAIFRSNLKNWSEERDSIVISNARHKAALDKSSAAIERALVVLTQRGPLEIIAIELREAVDYIGEITGVVTNDDILNRIFNDFCIGK